MPLNVPVLPLAALAAMGERKVINKYFPPDFDPTKIPRSKKASINPNFVVRMMLPMSVRCNTCGEYMYKGKKFNSRKEDVEGPEGEYLGIKIFRFYFKCITCSAEFSIKTDPQNMDYAVETGVKRNFEPYKDVEQQKKNAMMQREESEKDDAMAKLENKTKDSKVEMDILDALDEIRTQNARNSRLQVDDIIEKHRQMDESENAQQAAQAAALDDNEEDEVRRAFREERIKRLRDEDEGGQAAGSCSAADSSSAGCRSSGSMGSLGAGGNVAQAARASSSATSAPKRPKLPAGIVIQSKAKGPPPAAAPPPTTSSASAPADPVPVSQGGEGASTSGGLLGLGAYDSNESNSDSS